MKKLNIYIILETIGPFLAGILFFTFIFVIQLMPELFRLIVNNGAPLLLSLEIFVYMLPFNVAITIPMSILMASIMGYGRLSSDNEIIVMRALGLKHMTIYKPIILLGIFTFIFALFFNNVIMTESNFRYRALISYIINIRPSIAVGKLEFTSIPDMDLSIGAEYSDKSSLSNIVIFDNVNSTKRVINAKSGTWIDNKANSRVVTLRLTDGVVQEMHDYGFVSNDFSIFDSMDINIVRKVSVLSTHDRGLRELPAWKIYQKMGYMRTQASNNTLISISNEVIDRYNLFTNKLSTETNLESEDNTQIIDINSFSNSYIMTNMQRIEEEKAKSIKEAVPYYYFVEFHKFISIPAACLFMVIIGAPLGIVGKRSGRGFGFGISVIVVVIYYFLITGAELLAGSRKFPAFFAMWFPNIVLAIIGTFFMVQSFFSKGK